MHVQDCCYNHRRDQSQWTILGSGWNNNNWEELVHHCHTWRPGAEVSAISERDYKRLPLPYPRLDPPTQMMYGPTWQSLKVLVQFPSTLWFTQKGSLKGGIIHCSKVAQKSTWSPCALQLMSQVDAIGSNSTKKVHIPVLPSRGPRRPAWHQAQTRCTALCDFHTKKCANFPPHQAERKAIQYGNCTCDLQSQLAHPRCLGMVVVLTVKSSLHMHTVYCRQKPLNKNVLSKAYLIPAVSHTLAQLNEAKLSKLNANSSIWQIPLTPSSEPSAYNVLCLQCSLLHMADMVSLNFHLGYQMLQRYFSDGFWESWKVLTESSATWMTCSY